MSAFPSGNHLVRFAIDSPAFSDNMRLAVHRPFDGHILQGGHWSVLRCSAIPRGPTRDLNTGVRRAALYTNFRAVRFHMRYRQLPGKDGRILATTGDQYHRLTGRTRRRTARPETGGAGIRVCRDCEERPNCGICQSLLIALFSPTLGLDWKAAGPIGKLAHDLLELFFAAELFGYLGNRLVVHAQNDRVSRGFEAQEGVRQKISADRLDHVLAPSPVINVLYLPLVGDAVDARECDVPGRPPEGTFDHRASRVHVVQDPTRRQPQIEPRAVSVEAEPTLRGVDPVIRLMYRFSLIPSFLFRYTTSYQETMRYVDGY
jgi:hypothetical protein